MSALALGTLLTFAAHRWLPVLVPDLGRPHLPLASVLVVFGVSLLIGLVAGGYPAARAARLHPIDALRG